MKKIVLVMLIMLIVCSTNVIYAGETQYEDYAIELSKINMFVGTGNGFELDREPTRLEGLIMLTRLLGLEEQAVNYSGEKSPFIDVPDWGKKYVDFAYNKGLTYGLNATKFGSSDTMISNTYMTFILRALGYNDSAGDFEWSNAAKYSNDIDVIDDQTYIEIVSSTFLRGHIAKTSYLALMSKYYGLEVTLLDKLVSDNTIDVEIAESLKGFKPNSSEKRPTSFLGGVLDSVVMIQSALQNEKSYGSGVVIGKNGQIVTNVHVIKGANQLEIQFNDGTTYSGDVIIDDYDVDNDLVVLRIKNDSLLPASMKMTSLSAGDKIFAIGSPYGLLNTVSEGIVSSIRERDIQVSCALSPGSSGGPIVNSQGEVVGIVYSGIVEGENLGFAIPIKYVYELNKTLNLSLKQFNLALGKTFPPENIVITNITSTSAEISWSEVEGAEYYYFYYQKTGEDTYWYDVDTNEVQLRYNYSPDGCAFLTGLTPNTVYNIIVTSVENDTESSDSDTVSFMTARTEFDEKFYMSKLSTFTEITGHETTNTFIMGLSQWYDGYKYGGWYSYEYITESQALKDFQQYISYLEVSGFAEVDYSRNIDPISKDYFIYSKYSDGIETISVDYYNHFTRIDIHPPFMWYGKATINNNIGFYKKYPLVPDAGKYFSMELSTCFYFDSEDAFVYVYEIPEIFEGAVILYSSALTSNGFEFSHKNLTGDNVYALGSVSVYASIIDGGLYITINDDIDTKLLPPMLEATPINSTEALLYWDNVQGADYYHVYYYDMATDVFDYIYNTENLPFRYYYSLSGNTIYYLSPNNYYSFYVTAVQNGIESEFSNVVTIKTLPDVTPVLTSAMKIYSSDGTYLGKLTTNKYDLESIFNQYGEYGSEYRTDSIWNNYGTYGGKYSSKSAFNEYASDPPMIYKDGVCVGRLTINKYRSDGISPIGLYDLLKSMGY